MSKAAGSTLAGRSATDLAALVRGGEVTAEEVVAQLGGRISLVLDGGPTTGGVASTVVDCTTDEVKVLREGAISASEIRETLAAA